MTFDELIKSSNGTEANNNNRQILESFLTISATRNNMRPKMGGFKLKLVELGPSFASHIAMREIMQRVVINRVWLARTRKPCTEDLVLDLRPFCILGIISIYFLAITGK